MENNVDFPSVVSGTKTIADIVMKFVYEIPSKKSEYALDEKVKEKILNDSSLPWEDRLTLCYGYSKVKKKLKKRKDVLELADHYFNHGTATFYEKMEEVDEDWFEFFIDKVENTSGDKFKSLWANLLSAHLTNLESGRGLNISKKLISTICLLTQEDIIAFHSICCMTFDSLDRDISKYPFIYVTEDPRFLADHNVRRYNLASLDQLGLIEYGGPSESFVLPQKIPKIKYHNITVEFIESEKLNQRIDIGNVRLTSDGRMLYELTKGSYIKGFFDICKAVWDKKGYQYKAYET